MEDSELAAVTKFVMRDKQHLGALRIREGVITLEQLYFADEIRPVKEIKASKRKVERRQLQMAQELIKSFSGKWKPEQYKDTHRDELMKVIKAKRKGQEIHRATEVEEEGPPDLMAALRQSLEAAQRGGKPQRRSARNGGSSASNGLNDLSKAELDRRAKKADIPGRSSMSKEELIRALAKAS
jgi:DNA end-binding protein Ku